MIQGVSTGVSRCFIGSFEVFQDVLKCFKVFQKCFIVFQKCFMNSDCKSNHILLAERKTSVFFVDSTNNISAIVYKVFQKVFQSVSQFSDFFSNCLPSQN